MIPYMTYKGEENAIIYSYNYRATIHNIIWCKVFDGVVLLKEKKILRSSRDIEELCTQLFMHAFKSVA